MNAQEAIKAIRPSDGLSIEGKAKRVAQFIEGLSVATEALEKQVPKGPVLSGDGYSEGKLVYDTWECPNCGEQYEIEYDDYDYCPKCGQAIEQIRLE